MRQSALAYIACPMCKAELILAETGEQTTDEHIMSGRLTCPACHIDYPIVRGVPRLLIPQDQTEDVATGDSYAAYFSLVVQESNNQLYGKTPEAEMVDFFEKSGFSALDALQGAAFLDAGCGLGRIDGPLAATCSSVVAFDITQAVERAFATWRSLPNVHIVQGSLTHLPAQRGRFDYVWCDGALPYVSDAELSVKELVAVCNGQGRLFAWCYGPTRTLGQRLGRFFHATRLPIPLRSRVIFLVSVLMMAAASLIRRKNRLPNTRHTAEGILDLSLSHQINHVSEAQITTWVGEVSPGVVVRTRSLSNHRVMQFWIDSDETPHEPA